MNKRVLICVENLPVPQDRRVWLEAKTLLEYGYNVSIISIRRKDQKTFEILDGIWIYRYLQPPPTKGVFSYLFEFSYCLINSFYLTVKVWIQRGVDIFHACNPPDTFFLIGLFLKFFGKKVVFDQHDLCPEMYLSKYNNRKDLFYFMLLFFENLTYKTADIVISTNNSYKKIATKRGKISHDRHWVVRTGPDGFLSPGEPTPSLKEGFTHMALSLGVIGFQDGVDYLLKSIFQFTSILGRNDTLFIIIGSGDALTDMRILARELKIMDNIRFTGWLEYNQVLPYLRTADVGLVTEPKNDYTDRSTHNKVLEYMATGLPIVSFDLTEARYSAGESAIYAKYNNPVSFAEKLSLLLDDSVKMNRMGKIGRKRIEETLGWKHTHKELIKAYNSIDIK